MEELGLLFTNFEIKQQTQLLKLVSSVRSIQPLVIFPLVFIKQLSEKMFFQVKVIGITNIGVFPL